MSDVVAVIEVSSRRGNQAIELEIPVHSLEEVYETCRTLVPQELVRVTLRGTSGVLNLDFSSFMRG